MAICLERGADLHMAQLVPLPLTVSCFSKIQIGSPFWYRLTRVVPEKGPLNVCVCVCVCVSACVCELTHLQVRPVDGFSRLMAQTKRTRASMCLWGLLILLLILEVKYPKTPILGT